MEEETDTPDLEGTPNVCAEGDRHLQLYGLRSASILPRSVRRQQRTVPSLQAALPVPEICRLIDMGDPSDAKGDSASGENDRDAGAEEEASHRNQIPSMSTSQGQKRPVAKRGSKSKAKLSRERREKPRRPLSAYNFFFRVERERIIADTSNQIVQDQKDDPMGLFVSVGKMVALRWKQISTKDKEPYIKMAEDDMERYQAEMNQYRLREAQKAHSSEKDDVSSTAIQPSLSILHPFSTGSGAAGQILDLNVPMLSRGTSVDISLVTAAALQQFIQKSPNQALSVVDAMNTLVAQGGRGAASGMPVLSPLEQQLLVQQQLQQQQLQQQQLQLQLQQQPFMHNAVPDNNSAALLQALIHGEERRRQELLVLQQLAQQDQQERLLSLVQSQPYNPNSTALQQTQQQMRLAPPAALTTNQDPRFDVMAASALIGQRDTSVGAKLPDGSMVGPTQQPIMSASQDALWGKIGGHLGLLGASSQQPPFSSHMAPIWHEAKPHEGGKRTDDGAGSSSAGHESSASN